MTEIKAKLNNLRISPRKARLVADLVRNKKANEAEKLLKFVYKKSAEPFLKLLKSAIANAKNNFNLHEEGLFVKELKVDKGRVLKRFMPRARGVAKRINKRTSHISLILDNIQNQKKLKVKSQKIASPAGRSKI